MSDFENNEEYKKFLEFRKKINTIENKEETVGRNSVEINDDENNIPLTKPKTKNKSNVAKKPKSEKQLEQFKLAQQKRKENIEKKNYEKKLEASKLLLQHETTKRSVSLEEKKKNVVKPKKEIIKDESSEEEQIVVIKKPKPKKKVIKLIVSESDTNDDTSSDEEEFKPKIKQREMISQKNKKSVIKQHDTNDFYNNKKTDFCKFFCD